MPRENPGAFRFSYERSAAGVGAAAIAAATPAIVAAAAPDDDQQDDDPAAVAAAKTVIAHTGTSHEMLIDRIGLNTSYAFLCKAFLLHISTRF